MSPKAKQEVPQVIEAQKLIIRGLDGAAQVEIAAGDEGPTFLMFDRKGEVRAAIIVEDDKVFLGMDSASGHRRIWLGAVDGDEDGDFERTKLNLYGSGLDGDGKAHPDWLASISCGPDNADLGLCDVLARDDGGIFIRPRVALRAGTKLAKEGVHISLRDNDGNAVFDVPETAESVGARVARGVEAQILAKVREWCINAPGAEAFIYEVFEEAMEQVAANIDLTP